MRLEELFDKLCMAARRALERPGEPVPIEGLESYMIEFIPEDEEKGVYIPGLHIPPSGDKPEGSFDVGYGMDIARMCDLDHVIRGSCMIDEATVVHMHELYRRGWFVRVWKPGTECWAELITALEEGESN